MCTQGSLAVPKDTPATLGISGFGAPSQAQTRGQEGQPQQLGVGRPASPLRPPSPHSLALSSLNRHAEAVAHYKKALELDPSNETYKSNLQIAELKLRETPSPVRCRAGAGGLALSTGAGRLSRVQMPLNSFSSPQTGGVGSLDIAGLLNNPGFMSMVTAWPPRQPPALSPVCVPRLPRARVCPGHC